MPNVRQCPVYPNRLEVDRSQIFPFLVRRCGASILIAGSPLSLHTLLNIRKRCNQFAVFFRQLLRKFVRPLFDPINSCAQVVEIFSQGDIFGSERTVFFLQLLLAECLFFQFRL